jgi:Concanavalin A-like lectin/glucanases superfamily
VRFRGATFAAGLGAALGLALASYSPALMPRSDAGGAGGGGGGGSAGSTSAAGTTGAAGEVGGAGTTGASGATGGAGVSGGAAGTGDAGTTGGGSGVTGASDTSGDASVSEAGADTGAPCPGAGKALHFEDDLKGTKTKSMQVWADLGADTPTGDAARTVEMWLYMEGAESWKAEHSIIEYGGTGRCQAFGIDGGDNGTKDPAQFDPFTFSSGGPCKGDDDNSLSPQPPRTGWLHLAWVYDPAGKLAYDGMTGLNFMFTVNGAPQPIPDKKQMGALLTMKTKISLGSGQITDDGFTGKMDEVRIWNVARSAQEIADNYKLILKGTEPGLVAYYHFDDGVGTTPKDSSAAHHDAAFNTDGGRPIPTWVDATDLVLDCAK